MKSNSSHMPQLPNLYNRNHNTYFQSPHQAFVPPLPVYSTTVTNSPIAMMNYFNTPSNRNLQQHQQHHQHQQVESSIENSFLQQHIPVDMVTTNFIIIIIITRSLCPHSHCFISVIRAYRISSLNLSM